MTPFMMKHIKSYMMQNTEMFKVAQLAGNVGLGKRQVQQSQREKALRAKALARERLQKLKA